MHCIVNKIHSSTSTEVVSDPLYGYQQESKFLARKCWPGMLSTIAILVGRTEGIHDHFCRFKDHVRSMYFGSGRSACPLHLILASL